MKTRRTPWWQYVIGAVLGLLAGIGLASYGESSGLSLIGAPRIVTGLLAVLGVIVLILALQVHKYANTDPRSVRIASSIPLSRCIRWCWQRHWDWRAQRSPAGMAVRL